MIHPSIPWGRAGFREPLPFFSFTGNSADNEKSWDSQDPGVCSLLLRHTVSRGSNNYFVHQRSLCLVSSSELGNAAKIRSYLGHELFPGANEFFSGWLGHFEGASSAQLGAHTLKISPWDSVSFIVIL